MRGRDEPRHDFRDYFDMTGIRSNATVLNATELVTKCIAVHSSRRNPTDLRQHGGMSLCLARSTTLISSEIGDVLMARSEVEVRPAVQEDHEAIVELLDSLAAEEHQRDPEYFGDRTEGLSLSAFADLISRTNELHLVTQIEGVVAGYVRAWRYELGGGNGISIMNRRHAVHVQVMVVNPMLRRRGIGRALLAAIDSWAQEREAEVITLNVSQGNGGAKDFYRANGFGRVTEFLVKPLLPI